MREPSAVFICQNFDLSAGHC